MCGLSKLPLLRLFRSGTRHSSVGARPAHDHELPAAVRLVLASSGTVSEEQVREFVDLAKSGSPEAGGVWVGVRDEQLVTAAVPVVNPGRTMLLLVPARSSDELFVDLTRMAIEAACQHAASAGVVLAQALVEPRDPKLIGLFKSCSFQRLSELIYLQSSIGRHMALPDLPPGHHWVQYSTASHARFAQTILRAYENSLDCPGLNGLRDIEDIIAGHRATGEFDPSRWVLLCHGEAPVGVLLLSAVPRGEALEVVYLGLVPEARGRGLGSLLMRQAAAVASAAQLRLTLAVDADNLPALKLYWHHGMQSICRKLALLRDLRSAG